MGAVGSSGTQFRITGVRNALLFVVSVCGRTGGWSEAYVCTPVLRRLAGFFECLLCSKACPCLSYATAYILEDGGCQPVPLPLPRNRIPAQVWLRLMAVEERYAVVSFPSS